MAYAGSLVALVAVLGAFLYWKRKLEQYRWFLWAGVFTTFLPFVATSAGWILTEVGRQPWIVQGLLKTSNANSPLGELDLDRHQPGRVRRRSTSSSAWSTCGSCGASRAVDPDPDPAASPTAAPEPQPAVGY